MSRDFDGTDDNITWGSDATMDDLASWSILMWVRSDAGASAYDWILGKSTGSDGWQVAKTFANNGIDFIVFWSTLHGQWISADGTLPQNIWRHIAIVYSRSASTNDPVIYSDAVALSLTKASTPSGTYVSDATGTAKNGEDSGGGSDLDGAIACQALYSGILDAAAVNRAKWWGRPHGGPLLYTPFFTDKLANEGSISVTGTATGTTVAPAAIPVVRPGSAMMGMGIGW